MKNFKLTPEWVLNNLPQGYGIVDEELEMVTNIEMDYVLIKKALQTLRIQYYAGEGQIEGVTIYGVLIQFEDVRQVLFQKLKELKHNNETIRNFVSPPETGEVLSVLFMLSKCFGTEVSKINNESHHINEILSSLSELLASKCKFYLDADRGLSYNFKIHDEKFLESEEFVLLVILGALACFQINLEYLELRNPLWKGLNMVLSKAFPQIYEAYIKLSKKFGFTTTAKLLSDPSISEEGKQKYLLNPEVENWDSDLLELDVEYLEEEIKQPKSNVNERLAFLSPLQIPAPLIIKSTPNPFSAN